MKKNIYIYSDEGVGAFSLTAVRDYFSSEKITLVTAEDIVKSGIPSDVDVFVMPGGADRPYMKKLNGAGNQKIKEYVKNGGVYLGICAGAYYGCDAIEFQKDTPHAICEDRELSLFNGTAVGCIPDIASRYDLTLNSASITNMEIDNHAHPVFYWGGCYFVPNDKAEFKIYSSYAESDGRPPAIISCRYGEGLAILSGVHFEVSEKTFRNYDFDNPDENSIKSVLVQKMGALQNLPFDDILKQARG
ncbi:MAG TPA: BPL-N domain-containing protein [Alphaproteobacteria bacterium]|nr:BPL-N domain-containing protein [Alphaproteobacteria bacterium]